MECVFTDAGIRTRGGAGAEFGEASVVVRNIGKMLSSRVVEEWRYKRKACCKKDTEAARKHEAAKEIVQRGKEECASTNK